MSQFIGEMKVAAELMARMFLMPPDMKVMGAWFDPGADVVVLVVSSPELPEGSGVVELTPEYQERHWSAYWPQTGEETTAADPWRLS